MDSERRIAINAGVVIDGSKIIAVDTIAAIRERFPNIKETGGANVAVLPGLVNTHMHLSCSLFRGYIDDLPLLEHDVKFLFPGQRAMTDHNVYYASLLSTMELLKNGVTTTADAYLLPQATAKAMVQSGIRGIVSPAMMDTWLGGEERPVVTTTDEAIEEVQRLRDDWHGAAGGRIQVWPAPFTDLSASPELMRRSGDLARRWGSGIQIHLAETHEGCNLVKRIHGKSVLELVESNDLLEGNRVIAAHCCWVTERDIAIIKRHHVAIGYCPSCEMKMADGVAPVARLLHDGVCVSIAIDATCVNNSADLFREAKLGAILQKTVYPFDAEVIPAEQALELITRVPARALGLATEIGSLELGKKADVITIRLDGPHYVPLLDRPRPTIINHLIYSTTGNDVSDVFVDGVHVVAKGQMTTIDEQEVIESAQKAMMDFVENSGIGREITPFRWLDL
jgi:5-methylthioadenosine/S-adenosylhomocysteine deaminase